MMRTTKRLLSMLLACMLVLACAVPAGAQAQQEPLPTEPQKAVREPLIIVNGMGESPLLMEQGTKNERIAWPPDGKEIAKTVFKILPLVPLLLLYRDGFNQLAYPILRDLFDDVAYNPDGTSKHTVGQVRFPDSYANDKTGKINKVSHGKVAALYGAENSYQFVIDWRESGVVEGERLRKFIEDVCEENDSDTVKIMAVSMGGGAAMGYIAKNGHERISTLVMMHTVFQGMPIVSDLFSNRLTFDSTTLRMFIDQALQGKDFWQRVVSGLMRGLDCIGFLDGLLRFAEKVINYMNPELYQDMIVPAFAQLPGFWGLVSDDDFEPAKKLLLDPEKHAGLIKKIDDYHYDVFNRAEELLDAAMADGVNCYVLSGYNFLGVPIGPSARTHTDDGLGTSGTSGGATCALVGETLGGNYKQAVNCGHNHMEPDGMIDASTCILPEQTWFQKNLHHASFFSEDCLNFLLWLIESEELLSVHTSKTYPQYMQYANEELKPIS